MNDEFQEKGAVLILIALLLISIFGFAALATELTQYSTAVSQARNTANLAALGAVEESSSFDTTHPIDEVLTAALTRAKRVSGLNLGQEQADNLDASSKKLLLKAGRWYYAQPPTGNPCSDKYPCFEEGATDANRPNAFQVVGDLFQPFPFQFARAAFGGGDVSFPIKVSSTATIIPRRGCFLVDLSPTTFDRTTHAKDKSSTYYGNIAYDMGDPTQYQDPDPLKKSLWGNVKNPRTTNPTSPTETVHYQEDFDQSDTLIPGGVVGDGDYGSDANFTKYHPDPSVNPQYSNQGKFVYKLDMFPRPSSIANDYKGPEPMNTVFEGLTSAVTEYQKRAVVGDQMCVIFFDQTLQWSRYIKLTSDFAYVKKIVDPNDPVWGGSRQKWLKNIYRLKLFPGIQAQTDMQLAIAEAVSQFDEAKLANPGMPSSDFIVLIGGGIQTCYDCIPPLGPVPFDSNGDKLINMTDKNAFDYCYSGYGSPASCAWADANGDGYVQNDIADKNAFDNAFNNASSVCTQSSRHCSNDYLHYDMGIHQLVNFVKEQVYPKKIPIHVIQVGSVVEPYTNEYEDPDSGTPKKCFSDYVNRVKGNDVVDGIGGPAGCKANQSNGEIDCDPTRVLAFKARYDVTAPVPFTEANTAMYQIASITGGLWGPLRPQGTSCTPGEETCTPGKNVNDPKCRPPQDQMKGYVKEIMGQNPFTIVEQYT